MKKRESIFLIHLVYTGEDLKCPILILQEFKLQAEII
jgi:hypothetical protein